MNYSDFMSKLLNVRMLVMSAFLLLVCSFQKYSGLMKWGVINKTVQKKLKNDNFQIIVSLL